MKFLTLLSLLTVAVCANAEDSATPTPSPRVAPANLRAPTVVTAEDHRRLASTPYPTRSGPPTTTTGVCFSGPTTVEVQGVKGAPSKMVAMKDLQVGDKVLSDNNSEKYQQVYAFAHHNPLEEAEFLQFKTTTDDVLLEVTYDHLVYVQGNEYPVRAASIKVGDSLVTGPTDNVNAAKITSIETVTRTGVYTPLTPNGNVFVNRQKIKASNYATPVAQNDQDYHAGRVEFQNGYVAGISQHSFMHLLLTPLRMVCMGMAPQWCQNEVLLTAKGNKPAYIAGLWHLSVYARDHLPAFLQALLMAVFVIVLAPLALVEYAVGPFLAPAVIALMGMAGYWYKKNRNNRNSDQKIKTV